MSTGPETTLRAIKPEQSIAARLAGFLCLLNYALAIFGQLTPSWIEGSGDFAQVAHRALTSQHLYRTALATMAVAWVTIVFLAFALYVTLEPVNKRLAQLALFCRLGESFTGAVTVMLSFAALWTYTPDATGPFRSEQLQSLISLAQTAYGSGFQTSMTFLSVGSTLFFFLFYRSRYIPRILAAFGVFASILMLIVSLASLILPEHGGTLQYGWGPIGVAEIVTAFWLLIVGIRGSRSTQISKE